MQAKPRGNHAVVCKKPTPAMTFLWLHNIHPKRHQPSCPLYALDFQLWQNLASYLTRNSIDRLIATGDKQLTKGLLPTIKSLHVHRFPNEVHVLSLALGSNLERLIIEQLPGNAPNVNVCKIIVQEALPNSRLKSFTVTYLRVGIEYLLKLPATLKSLEIAHLDWSYTTEPYDYVALNGAKLEKLCLGSARCNSNAANWQLQHFADELIAKSKTLEWLSWTCEQPCGLNLAPHSAMQTLTLSAHHLDEYFVPPPNVSCLVMKGPIVTSAIIQSVAVNFSKSLVHLDMSRVWGASSTLDISPLCNIERLTCDQKRHGIICAPTNHLVIVSKMQPTFLINKGSGSVSIECFCLYLSEGNLPPSNVCDAVCWPDLQSLEIYYSDLVPPVNHIDYGILRRGINIQKIHIYGDMLGTFAHRDGHQFLDMFPRIASLDWTLEIDLCNVLKSSSFSLPSTVKRIRVGIIEEGNLTIAQTMHHAQWVNSRGMGTTGGDASPFVPTHSFLSNNVVHFDRYMQQFFEFESRMTWSRFCASVFRKEFFAGLLASLRAICKRSDINAYDR